MSLKQKTINGVLWSFAQQFSSQIISFFISIILARLLSPADFGLIGLITILISVGSNLMDAGLTTSLIRTKNTDLSDYSTVFITNFAGSIVIYIISFSIAPLIAKFFNQEKLVNIIRVYCLSFVINSFSSVQLTRLTKAMNFKLQMQIQLPSIILAGILGVFLAFSGYGVWSLVYMALFQSFLTSSQLWLRTKWHPTLSFDVTKFKRHFHFGYKLMLSSILDSLFNNIYNIVIGKYFSLTQLGYYTRAINTRDLPIQNISLALNKVTYPLFSNIQNDDVKLKLIYKRVMQQVLYWVCTILLGLILIADPLFEILFTEKWAPAVPYFKILCFAGIMYPLHSYNLHILNVKGRSDLFFKLEVIKKIIIVAGVVIAIQFNIYSLLIFQIIFNVVAYFVNTTYSGRMINYKVGEQLKDVLPIFFVCFSSAFLVYLINFFLIEPFLKSNIITVIITGAIFLLVNLIIARISKLAALKDFFEIVLKK